MNVKNDLVRVQRAFSADRRRASTLRQVVARLHSPDGSNPHGVAPREAERRDRNSAGGFGRDEPRGQLSSDLADRVVRDSGCNLFESGVHAQGPEEAADVVANRLGAREQLIGDLSGRAALLEETKHLGLTPCEARVWSRGPVRPQAPPTQRGDRAHQRRKRRLARSVAPNRRPLRPFCGHGTSCVSHFENKRLASAGLSQVGGTGLESVTPKTH